MFLFSLRNINPRQIYLLQFLHAFIASALHEYLIIVQVAIALVSLHLRLVAVPFRVLLFELIVRVFQIFDLYFVMIDFCLLRPFAYHFGPSWRVANLVVLDSLVWLIELTRRYIVVVS